MCMALCEGFLKDLRFQPVFKTGHVSVCDQVEGQKAAQARLQAEQAVLSKLDRIRIDQTSRADALEREALEAEAKVCMMAYVHLFIGLDFKIEIQAKIGLLLECQNKSM